MKVKGYHINAFAGHDSPRGWKITLECHGELSTCSPKNDEYFESVIQSRERRVRRKHSEIGQGGEFGETKSWYVKQL